MAEISEVLVRAKEFLQRSSNYYCNLIKRKKRDLEVYSGNFWSQDIIDSVDRKNRLCRSFTLYQKFANAVVSPYTKSPYHADIEDNEGLYGDIQTALDNFENDNNFKNAMIKAVHNACVTGVGYVIISTQNGKPVLEHVRDITAIALDPCIQEITGNDAEKGAVVNIISKAKAKRLYGEDVYLRDNDIFLSYFGQQWKIDKDSIAVVSYYEMNENGTVDYYKLCGDKVVVDKIELPFTRIPIYRIAYNEVIRNDRFDYNGIVDMTYDLQFGLNLGYSTMLERMNRSPKATFMMHVNAIDGLEEYYRKGNTKEGLVYLYNGDQPPIPIVEQYQTQDLTQTMQNCIDLMSSTIGVAAQGINPAQNSKTATEILIQNNNSESNVESLYLHAQDACREITKSVLEALCYEQDLQLPTFKLINGPEVITKNMKRRQELLAVSNLVDEKTRTIIAKHYIATLDADVKDGLTADIIANNPEINFISDNNQGEDARAVAVMQRLGAIIDETQNELEAQIAANAELKKELDMANLQLLNAKEQHILDMTKIQNDYDIQSAKLDIEAAKVQNDAVGQQVDAEIKIADADQKAETENIKMQQEMMKLEEKKLDIIQKSIS